MSPECVMYGRFTLESDIWSYGVVLWEIYSFGKQPYYGHTNDQVLKLIYEGIILIPPEDCPAFICEIMRNCWKTEPRDRIKFPEICERLEKVFENYQNENEKLTGRENIHCVQINIDDKLKDNSSMKRLPRPPLLLPKLDLLDHQGYLLPNELNKTAHYLETIGD